MLSTRVFGINFKTQIIASPNTEIERLRHEAKLAEEESIEKATILEKLLPVLQVPFPTDSNETALCQDGANKAINQAKATNHYLERTNKELLAATELLYIDVKRQEQAHVNSTKIVQSFKPPDVVNAQILQLRASSIIASELIHTRIFEDTSICADIGAFDIAVKRILDVNAKNNQGRAAIDYATEYMFEHGIKTLLKKDANAADALIYALLNNLPEAAKLLVTVTGYAKHYEEIFLNLRSDNILTHLDLAGTKLSPDGIVHLSKSLALNTYLSFLNISDNNIGIIGAKALGQMLAINHFLNNLNISNGNLGYEGVRHIANALEKNGGIRILNISNNNIPEEGGIVIASLIEQNSRITDLDVSSNNIENLGAAYILDRLSKNSSILRINLNYNNITDDLAEDILNIIEKYRSIVVLVIDGNCFSKDTAFLIKEKEHITTEANIETLLAEHDFIEHTYNVELLAEMQYVHDF